MNHQKCYFIKLYRTVSRIIKLYFVFPGFKNKMHGSYPLHLVIFLIPLINNCKLNCIIYSFYILRQKKTIKMTLKTWQPYSIEWVPVSFNTLFPDLDGLWMKMPGGWIPDWKRILLSTKGPPGKLISYFVENSSGCPFNYLIEIITAVRRHFYILISFKRKIVFDKIRLSITSSFLPEFAR